LKMVYLGTCAINPCPFWSINVEVD
jgi:hypothetical protein